MAFLVQNRLKTRKKCRFRIYLRNLKFGRKNGIFRTEQAKNEEKMQSPYILTDLFWVFCLEDKGFFGRNQIP